MYAFVSGMVTAGYLVAALFFFRFWKRTREPLFVAFSISFVLFACGQLGSIWFEGPHDDDTWTFLLRLAGFVLLLVGIVGKNFAPPAQK
jgi:peptidoglycan/LPS O-acetylase OafA/YrhL